MTIQEVKDKVAQEHYYSNWAHLLRGASRGNVNNYIDIAMSNYASHKIKEQLKIVVKAAEVKFIRSVAVVDKQSILDCPRVKLG